MIHPAHQLTQLLSEDELTQAALAVAEDWTALPKPLVNLFAKSLKLRAKTLPKLPAARRAHLVIAGAKLWEWPLAAHPLVFGIFLEVDEEIREAVEDLFEELEQEAAVPTEQLLALADTLTSREVGKAAAALVILNRRPEEWLDLACSLIDESGNDQEQEVQEAADEPEPPENQEPQNLERFTTLDRLLIDKVIETAANIDDALTISQLHDLIEELGRPDSKTRPDLLAPWLSTRAS